MELKESLTILASRFHPEGENRRDIENTILAAVKHVDVAVVLKAIPLSDTNGDIDIDHSWMLPLLREGLRKSSLEYFYTDILPLASVCLRKWKCFELAGKKNESHIYELFSCQLWGLFPGFCRQPRDCEKFCLIARTVGKILNENLYLRAPILDGFKELIPSVIAERTEVSVSKYVNNYLPILFNLYVIKPKGSYENDLRVSILDIIKLFLKISPDDSVNEMFNTVFNRLKNTNEGDFAYNMLFDIIECFTVHLKPQLLHILYDEYVKPIFNINKNKEGKNVQPKVKKAYRVICGILSNDNKSCQTFVIQRRQDLEELFLKSEKLNGDNVKQTRLQCLKYLMKTAHTNFDSELVRQCVTETVLCFPNNPEKPNKLCTEMNQILGNFFTEQGKLDEFVILILSGITSDNTDFLIKTIWSVNSILQLFGTKINSETLSFVLENLYTSVQSNYRMEAKAALCTLYTFTKHTTREILTTHLEGLVKTISKMIPDTKRFCRLPFGHLLKKLCQYYGVQEITRFVPGNDLVTHKRLKKVRKDFSRIKNQPNAGKSNALDDDEINIDQKLKTITISDILKDSDSSDFEDREEEDHQVQEKEKQDKRLEVYIKEDDDSIVDLKDVNAVSKVSFKNKNKYRNKNKNDLNEDSKITFKTAPDGRLIIEEPKMNRKDFLIVKTGSATKRPLESDVSELETDDETDVQTSKSKFFGHKNKKIMSINKNSNTAMSVASSKKSVKSTKSSSNKKECNLRNKKHMQPYAYFPLGNSLNIKKKNK